MKIIIFVTSVLLLSNAFPQTKRILKGKNEGRYHSISLGAGWLDTDGKPIQAHGFSVFTTTAPITGMERDSAHLLVDEWKPDDFQ